MRRVMILLVLALLVYALIVAAFYVAQRSLIYHPQPRRAPSHTPFFMLEVPGASVQVTTRLVDGAPSAVLYFGGNAEDVASSLPLLERAFPDASLYLMHYRGWGASSGRPSESALVSDATRLLDHVRAAHSRVTVVGRSLGSGVAVQLAAARPEAVWRLVLVTPYDSLLAIGQRHFAWLPVRWMLHDRFDAAAHAPRVTAPTTVLIAEHDEVIARAHSDALVRALPREKTRVHVIDGAGHNTIDTAPGYAPLLAGAEAPR